MSLFILSCVIGCDNNYSQTGENYQNVDQVGSVEQLRTQAEKGDASAQNGLGLLYLNGDGGLPKDAQKAVYWFRKAAQQGLEGGQFNLGMRYKYGEGVSKDAQKATYWIGKAVARYRQGAEKGDALEQWNLGSTLYNGNGVPKDEATGLMWIRKSAAQGQQVAIDFLKEKGL